MSLPPNPHYHGLVDMGSNGIRFSISDLSPPTTRIMPTVFQDRTGISLYNAQYPASSTTRQPIPQATIDAVLTHLLRFKTVCADFGVPESNIRVLATEATRTAINSQDFLISIKTRTGWTVELLPKAEEGRIGALGVASSFSSVSGLVMDLGGGSTQLTWMVSSAGSVRTSEVPISLPYGAAALTRRLATEDPKAIRAEMLAAYRTAYADLHVPQELTAAAEKDGGLTLYLSGGGFRGWGYLLLSQHRIDPYPIPIINGFTVSSNDFLRTSSVQTVAETETVFRVSSRRASQVPAVATLIEVIQEALPPIKQVRFCQGGVREGALFAGLPAEVRAQMPLSTATAKFAAHLPSVEHLARLLGDALPDGGAGHPFTEDHLKAIAGLMATHGPLTTESRATAALECTTVGVLAGAHGVSHFDRGVLALVLCARWGGEVSNPGFKKRMEDLVGGTEVVWWCRYLGAVAEVLGSVYPAGVVVDVERKRIELKAAMKETGMGKKGHERGVELTVRIRDGVLVDFEDLEKLGKKKKWVDGWGMRVEVVVMKDL